MRALSARLPVFGFHFSSKEFIVIDSSHPKRTQ